VSGHTHHGEGFTTVADFTVGAGEQVPFALTWHHSYERAPEPEDPIAAVAHTEARWREWIGRCT
jgi:hypothetical protein